MPKRLVRAVCRGSFHRKSSNYSRITQNKIYGWLDAAEKLSEPRDVAVLGGGITGLTSAYFTSLIWPNAKITLFESSDRLGGWMRSNVFNVGSGKVVFEQGPRSLRPAEGTLALIVALGLEKDLLVTRKDSPAARNRYVYLENRLMPAQPTTGITEIFSNPLLINAIYELAGTFFKRSSRRDFDLTESVGEFLRRRGLHQTANNLVSAVMHGIYAGDLDELSIDAVLPTLAILERYYSPFEYMMKRGLDVTGDRTKVVNLYKAAMEDLFASEVLRELPRKDEYLTASIYTLKDGLQKLTDALIDNLRNNPQVKIVTGTRAEKIEGVPNDMAWSRVSLTVGQEESKNQAIRSYDRIVAAIPATTLAKICAPLKDILSHGTASTVCVTNLFYSEPHLTPVQGFGYLIPKSTPLENNPEGALGVVFDSDATPEMDTATGTKLTVMLGGPFWKGIAPEQLPSEDEAIEMARNVLSAQIGIKQEPLLAQANVHANCIPQYIPGHVPRMQEAELAMTDSGLPWTDCVKVAGSSYNGVGVNDCIQSAFYAVINLGRKRAFGSALPYRLK